MKLKLFIVISILIFGYNAIAQEGNKQFVVPDSIPEKVADYVRDRVHEMPEYKNKAKITAKFHVLNNKVYRISFEPVKEVKYFDTDKNKEINYIEDSKVTASSLGTKNIPLGWFRDLKNFGGQAERPFHRIDLGATNSYMEFNNKNVEWGYSSHHFEEDPFRDCYGAYLHTTQLVRLYISDIIGGTLYYFHCDFSNLETDYDGHYFAYTNVPVDNNAKHYEVWFRVDFEPPYIDGINTLCFGQQTTFKFVDNTIGAPGPTWTTSSNLEGISGQGTDNFTVKAVGASSSEGWVKATANAGCGDVVYEKTFWVGTPNKPVTSPAQSSMTDAKVGDIIPVNIISVEGGDKNLGNWSANGTISISNPFMNPGAGMIFDADAVGYGFWYVNVSNECGTSYNTSGTVDVSSSGPGGLPEGLSLTLSPNPVSSEMTVNIEQETNTTRANNVKTKYQVYIYHAVKGLVYTNLFTNSNFKIRTNNLVNGAYVLKVVSSGGNVGQIRFIKGN